MFDSLHTVLKLDAISWANRQKIAILEVDDADGSFVLHHLLSMSSENDIGFVVLCLDQTPGHFHAVQSKIGKQKFKNSSVRFVDGLKDIHQFYIKSDSNSSKLLDLNSFIDQIKAALLNLQTSKTCILIDQLSVLVDLSLKNKEIRSFLVDLWTLSEEKSSSIIVRSQKNDIATYWAHCSNLWLIVKPLDSGYSESATGDLEFSNKPAKESGKYLYKVNDRTVRVFAFGTGSSTF